LAVRGITTGGWISHQLFRFTRQDLPVFEISADGAVTGSGERQSAFDYFEVWTLLGGAVDDASVESLAFDQSEQYFHPCTEPVAKPQYGGAIEIIVQLKLPPTNSCSNAWDDVAFVFARDGSLAKVI